MSEPTDKSPKLVEAGWQALEAGDLAHAEKACAAALQCTPDSMEVLCLQAALAMTQGDIETAMALCQRAMTIDPNDPRPYIQAAELALYSEEDEEAIGLAKKAIDRAGDEGDFADALLIKASAELGAERDDEAQRTLSELEHCVVNEPPLLYRLGELWLEVGEASRAQEAFRKCLAQEPDAADAQHGLGLACEELGDESGALKAWRRVWKLDADRPAPSWHMSKDAFESVASLALAELPPSVLERIAQVPLHIEDAPSREEVERGCDPRLLGQLTGAAADTLRLFQLNLERAVGARHELEEEIRATVIHEVAQFFGLDEADLDALTEE